MIKNAMPSVEDTEENREICRRYCGLCPSYRHNSLERYPPGTLFCACGPSQAPSMKEGPCFCPACELFTRHSLTIGHFCTHR